MSRRVSLPGADELFRGAPEADTDERVEGPRAVSAVPDDAEEQPAGPRRGSGRVKHDEKMTVYVTADELLELEHARLNLRRDLGFAVDRGRLVREAIALCLHDLEERGTESDLARRLRET